MASILVTLERIFCDYFKCSFLENKERFNNFLCIFEIYIKFWALQKKASLIAEVFRKLLTLKDVVT